MRVGIEKISKKAYPRSVRLQFLDLNLGVLLASKIPPQKQLWDYIISAQKIS